MRVMISHVLIHVLIKCLLLRFGGGGGRYRCVAATLLDMILVMVLYVVRHDFSYAYRCFDIPF